MSRQQRSYKQNEQRRELTWMQNAQKTRWNRRLHGVRKQ